ncbi:dipeptidase [Actinophytocola sp.]|uniref:dipeptidase n=1 Tax=Actinophytocola sp. TaxID=1872138 RepID=UPI002D8055A8|nr:dipeptidase [Actinophytocola sp.]HET9139595.1 dipeptidase [Actinophytocola sp.]
MPVASLRGTVASLMEQARTDLTELVAFRSVADAQLEPPEECEKAAQWLVEKLVELGFSDATAARTPDGSKCVHGHVPGPPGTPTVLLYSHYDVQPPLGETHWISPIWQLTERDGRWYGRGAADCKGNIVMHLTALRALRAEYGEFPCTIKFLSEGSEEQGTGGLEEFVPPNADLLRADAILVVDTGNFAVGIPTLTTTLRGMTSVDVRLAALSSAMHSGMFGGPTPDPVLGLIKMLDSLHDERGNTTIDGLDANQTWPGVDYPAEQFRRDANVLDGVELVGDGSVADLLWARPTATVLGIDIPPVIGSSAAVQAGTAARVSVRVPPGITGLQAQDALVEHLRARVPWGLRCEIERVSVGDPFVGSLRGPAYDAMKASMEEACGHAMTTEGQGGSIPLCNVFANTYPDAEIMLFGVEEPKCLIHAPNESVDPTEIERTALAEALFLRRYATTTRDRASAAAVPEQR